MWDKWTVKHSTSQNTNIIMENLRDLWNNFTWTNKFNPIAKEEIEQLNNKKEFI